MIYPLSIESKNKLIQYINTVQMHAISSEFDVCKHFGCGKKLTLKESLAGAKCTKHTYEQKVNPMQVFKFK